MASCLSEFETGLADVPEECVSEVLARLESPRDVVQLATVSPVFLNASHADTVWDHFLPQDWTEICERAGIPVAGSSKRDLFFRLCQEVVLGEGSHEAVWLDRATGAISRRLFARGLGISWGNTLSYWRWVTLPRSASAEVASLWNVCWLDVRGRIKGTFTPGVYTLSWRLGWANSTGGFDSALVTFSLETDDGQSCSTDVFLNPPDQPVVREPGVSSVRHWEEGWLEYDVAEFTVTSAQESLQVSFGLSNHEGNWKHGLIVDGVVVRPSHLLPPSTRDYATYTTPMPNVDWFGHGGFVVWPDPDIDGGEGNSYEDSGSEVSDETVSDPGEGASGPG